MHGQQNIRTSTECHRSDGIFKPVRNAVRAYPNFVIKSNKNKTIRQRTFVIIFRRDCI